MATTTYSLMELMTVIAAREVADGEVVFAGTGLPMLGVMLAQKTHAPGCIIIFEAGTVASRLAHLPMSVGDPRAMRGAATAAGLNEVFTFVLQAGRVDVGFLSGAQVDRYGNINSTSIGADPRRPSVRFSGSGGACDIACLAKRTIIIAKHEKRRFPEKVDYVTSPGWLEGGSSRQGVGPRPGRPGRRRDDHGRHPFPRRHETALSGQLPSGAHAPSAWPRKRNSASTSAKPWRRRRRPRKNCAFCGTSSIRKGSS